MAKAGDVRKQPNRKELAAHQHQHVSDQWRRRGPRRRRDCRSTMRSQKYAKPPICALLYTSASHVPGIKERWRILVPLSKAREAEAREKFVARVNGLLDGKLAGESFTLSQGYLYGHVAGAEYRVEVIDGDFLDLRDDLYAGSIFKDGSRSAGGSAISTRMALARSTSHASNYELEPVDLGKIEARAQSHQQRSRSQSGLDAYWRSALLRTRRLRL